MIPCRSTLEPTRKPGTSWSIRSRTVSLPSACCLAMATAPPIASARCRRARSSSTSSFMPMADVPPLHELALDDGGPEGVDPGVGWGPTDEGEHSGDLAAVMRGVIDHVLEEWTEGHLVRRAPGALVRHRSGEVSVAERVDESPLLRLERIPLLAKVAHGGEVGVAR